MEGGESCIDNAIRSVPSANNGVRDDMFMVYREKTPC